MQQKIIIFLIVVLTSSCIQLFAQVNTDTVLLPKRKGTTILNNDTALKKQNNPRVATFRSAVLPGWGQAYNKKYWKIPFIYGALGTTGYIFFYNLKTYKKLRSAYIYKTDAIASNDALIDPRFKNLSAESIRSYRNSFRQNMDYSVLFFILFWGLNVVDATVDAHLKGFDVSDDLTLKIIPGKSQMANTSGISLVLRFREKPKSLLATALR